MLRQSQLLHAHQEEALQGHTDSVEDLQSLEEEIIYVSDQEDRVDQADQEDRGRTKERGPPGERSPTPVAPWDLRPKLWENIEHPHPGDCFIISSGPDSPFTGHAIVTKVHRNVWCDVYVDGEKLGGRFALEPPEKWRLVNGSWTVYEVPEPLKVFNALPTTEEVLFAGAVDVCDGKPCQKQNDSDGLVCDH